MSDESQVIDSVKLRIKFLLSLYTCQAGLRTCIFCLNPS